MKSLFGEEIEYFPPEQPKTLGKYQAWKLTHKYRKSESKDIRCKNCEHLCSGEYHNKNYHKCELMGISHSEATDIRVGYVCNLFKAVTG